MAEKTLINVENEIKLIAIIGNVSGKITGFSYQNLSSDNIRISAHRIGFPAIAVLVGQVISQTVLVSGLSIDPDTEIDLEVTLNRGQFG